MRTEARLAHDPLARALFWAATLTTGILLGFPGAVAETMPKKPPSIRTTFDFTPPHPGEILANPLKGHGSPPALREFAPSAAMHLTQNDVARSAAASQGDAGLQAAPTTSRPPSAGPPVQIGEMQMRLGEQIAKVGIDGFLSQPPPAGSSQEQQYWTTVRREIAGSLATWRTLYAAPAGGVPVAAPPAGDPKR